MRPLVILLAFISLTLLVSSCQCSKKGSDSKNNKNENTADKQVQQLKDFDPNDSIYKEVSIKWSKSGKLEINIPEKMDCFAKCPKVDLCALGREMLECFDTNKDTYIDVPEMDAAIGQLNFAARLFARGGQRWIDKFDGCDGSKPDGRVGFDEFVQSDPYHCTDFNLANKHFFGVCREERAKLINSQ